MKTVLIAVPYDSGHYNTRMGAGPSQLLPVVESALLQDGHAVRTEVVAASAVFPTEITTNFELCRLVADHVAQAKENGELPVIFSGNCNTAALGALGGLQHRSGLIWFDCHGDFNTPETTIGGFLDGMALAMATGDCWKALTQSITGFQPIAQSQCILVGTRDLDPLEAERLAASPITIIPPKTINDTIDLDRQFFPMYSIYLHIDLDVLDPDEVRANAFSTSGGITVKALLKCITFIRSKYTIAAVSFTAYNPSLDPEHKVHAVVQSIIQHIVTS